MPINPIQIEADLYVLGWDDPTEYDIESVEILEALAAQNRMLEENGIKVSWDYGDEMNPIAAKLGLKYDDSQGTMIPLPGGNNVG
jgi:hypothetical protein